ncbi:TetR/AcrR family transcriptional regulator [Priestia filamentosa]|uniref:TetR/AcrR family transcriptional regulator n=1 Tax=Priestia filamentosa TaxID=1402861 RepID=UPI0039832107
MERSIELKDTIVYTAKELFKTKGYSETTIGEIIKEANTSKGNLYYHFDNKEALFLYIFEQETKYWVDSWKQYLNDTYITDPIEKLYKFADHHFYNNFDYTLLQRFEEFFTLTFKSIETKKRMEEMNQEYTLMYKELLLECQEKELLNNNNLDDLTLLFMSLFTGIDYQQATSSDKKKNLYKLAIEVFLNGVLRKK